MYKTTILSAIVESCLEYNMNDCANSKAFLWSECSMQKKTLYVDICMYALYKYRLYASS